MNNSKAKTRLTYIDIARGIAILLVVIGHMNQFYRNNLDISNPQMLSFIYTLHIPLFFIISGMLFSEKSFKDVSFTKFLIKKIKTLIVPYLFLDITGGLFNVFVYSDVTLVNIKNVVVNTLTLHCNVGANWFISALFIGEIILYFFMKFYMPIYKYIAWIPFLLINVFYPFSHWINIAVRGVIAFTFILLGYYLKEFFKSDLNKRWYMILISLVITYMVSKFNGQIDVWGSTIGNPFLCVLGGLAGSYAVIGISKLISSKLLVFIGQNTMTMMGTHMILIFFIWPLLSKSIFAAFPSLTTSAVGAVLFFAIVIAVDLPIMYLYDRFIPFLIGKPSKPVVKEKEAVKSIQDIA